MISKKNIIDDNRFDCNGLRSHIDAYEQAVITDVEGLYIWFKPFVTRVSDTCTVSYQFSIIFPERAHARPKRLLHWPPLVVSFPLWLSLQFKSCLCQTARGSLTPLSDWRMQSLIVQCGSCISGQLSETPSSRKSDHSILWDVKATSLWLPSPSSSRDCFGINSFWGSEYQAWPERVFIWSI